ncbi:MAG TPA: PQQ-binding-like beta-propeller repeat protein [Myxococcales bacterium]|jgi:outer membrane protein assembly factor BamB
MVRVLTGRSWKLNPTYLSGLKTASRSRGFSASAVLDSLGVEVDGVDVMQGLAEAPIFEVVDQLAAVVLRLCREPAAGGQVPVADGAIELVLGRRGARASLCLVSLGRPARLLAGELEVDLSALALAVASCAQALLSDLTAVDPALERTSFARGLARRAELLRKAARLSGRKASRRAEGAPVPHECVLPAQPDAPAAGFVLFDEPGRLDSSRHGGELFSLLGAGELILRDARGAPMAFGKGPPFLALTDLSRAAADLVGAHREGAKTWEGTLSSGGSKLRLDLAGGLLTVEGRAVPCQALALARSFLQCALDYGGAIVARNPAQSKNPYLCALVDGAREQLELLRAVEGGELFADGGSAPRSRSKKGAGSPLTTGKLKRLRFRIAWRGVDTGARATEVALGDGALVVLSKRRATFLDAATGELLSKRTCDSAALSDGGVLVSHRSRLLGLTHRGAGRFVRDPGGAEQPQIVSTAGTLKAGEIPGPATLCVLEGARVAAVLSASGRAVWQFMAPQAGRVSACLLRDRVYAATDNGFLYALGAKDGLPVFRVRSNGSFEGSLTVGAGALVTLGRQDGALWITAVDAASGRPRLTRPVPLRAAGSPLPWRRLIVQGGVSDGESVVVGFSKTGKEAFRTSLGAACGVPCLTLGPGHVFASLRDGSVTCLAPDGSVAWRAARCGLELDHALAPVLRRGVLLAPGDPMRALDPKTGAILCELPLTQGLSALTVGPKLDVHAIDDDGVAACFQLATHLSVVG